jgi:hypothetical protein
VVDCELGHPIRLINQAASGGSYVAIFIFGYFYGHRMYFPSIEAASEAGYCADSGVSLGEFGAGERMMDAALINIYRLQGKFASDPR